VSPLDFDVYLPWNNWDGKVQLRRGARAVVDHKMFAFFAVGERPDDFCFDIDTTGEVRNSQEDQHMV
jgi:hypothetical protein